MNSSYRDLQRQIQGSINDTSQKKFDEAVRMEQLCIKKEDLQEKINKSKQKAIEYDKSSDMVGEQMTSVNESSDRVLDTAGNLI